MLLADDHAEVLKSASRLLSADFDVVATAIDGHEALAACQRSDPDVVVLDITMPGLDGFQTARELKRLGSRARIIFLTMHEADEYVDAAFRTGGQGYVLKTRLHSDLPNALDHVIAGRLFVPSLKSLFMVNGTGGHAALLYPHDRALIDELSASFDVALRHGDAVVLVADEPIRAGVAGRLDALGWNAGTFGAHGRYRAMDAVDTLSSVMRNGRPDAGRVAEAVAELERIRLATAEGPRRRMTMAGQIAVPLMLDGNLEAAMEIEYLWNELTHPLPLLGVCCYPAACFSGDAHPNFFSRLCDEHWAIGHARQLAATQ